MFLLNKKVEGKPTLDLFSEVPEVNGFIPQVIVNGFQFPFLLCDIDNVGDDLLSWDDPYNSYDFWNLIYDIPSVAQKKREERELTANDAYVGDHVIDTVQLSSRTIDQKIFSIVKDWGGKTSKKSEKTVD